MTQKHLQLFCWGGYNTELLYLLVPFSSISLSWYWLIVRTDVYLWINQSCSSEMNADVADMGLTDCALRGRVMLNDLCWPPVCLCHPGNWAKALPERFGRLDNIIAYYVNRTGEVYVTVNGEELSGPFFSGVSVSQPLWALVDIYGNATGVEFVGKTPSRLQLLVSQPAP